MQIVSLDPFFWEKKEKYFKISSTEKFTQHAKCYSNHKLSNCFISAAV